MKRSISLFASLLLTLAGAGSAATPGTARASAQEPVRRAWQTQSTGLSASKDPLAVAHHLYRTGQWAAARYEFERAARELSAVAPFAGGPFAGGPSTGAPFTGGQSAATPSAAASSVRIEAETFAALCAARLEDPAAAALLGTLLKNHPSSPYKNEVCFRAGVIAYDAADYAEARRLFAETDARRLPRHERDEFHFKSGHSRFLADDTPGARSELAKISSKSPYRPHADYYTAYMNYAEGRYDVAKHGFAPLAANPSYEKLVPYYLLQIEFLEGNYPYVARNASQLIAVTAMPRRAELARMAAQSWFRLENYAEALAGMRHYEELGGEMGRSENYLRGYSSYRETQYADAARYLALATGADDSLSQNASYHLADAYLRLGDKSRAMQSFSIAANSGRDAAIAEDALLNYGKLLYETGSGRFNEAVNVLGRYLADYPSSPHASLVREYLIAAYYNSHDYEAAYNAIMQHPDPDNNLLGALQKITYFRALERWGGGDGPGALELLETSSRYRYNTKYTALASFWQGEILYYGGDPAASIPRYEEYLRLSPTSERENIIARYNLGYANFNLEKWGQAQQWFDDFLERHRTADSYRADALNRKGDIHHAQRAYWRAIESYDAAAAAGTPERFYSAYQRAVMLGLVDRPERKIESLRAIIAKNEGPHVEDASWELGRTLVSQERYAEGERALSAFIAKYPASPHHLPALSNLALASLNMGDRARSMSYYKTIVDSAPWSREAQDAMASIRTLYVEANDIDGYFAYAAGAGIPTDTGEVQRDSLTFAAAERIYLSGDGAKAIPALENYLASIPGGRHVPAAQSYLSGLYFRAGRYSEAAGAYRRLAALSTDPASAGKAYDGYIASVVATGDGGRIVSLVDELPSLPGISEKSRRDALFAAAGHLREGGQRERAADIYASLADDVRTAAGAESAFRIIEDLYDRGEYRAAERAVFEFSEKGTPHGYWLGEAFLTLGDIYVREGDSFQARATYQSIVDGYSPSDDGIVSAARERISRLK